MRNALLGLLTAVVFTAISCNTLWPDSYWREERYVLIAVDSLGQMALSFDEQDGTAQALVGPTVFSIGANGKQIVVKQHPSKDGFGDSWDRSVTNYFVVERNASPRFFDRQKGVKGPFTEAEFKQLARTKSYPNFSKTFEDLK